MSLLLAAIKNAPPIQADLINYLWPIFVILFAGFLPEQRLTAKHIVAGLFGLIGVYILLTNGQGTQGFNMNYIKGYLLAFIDAIIWASYTLFSRYYHQTPTEMIGMYCGLGAFISLIAHFKFEFFVPPTQQQIYLIILMGFSTSGLAYFLWDYGTKKGNVRLLSILAYGNPIISCLLLIFFGQAEFSSAILLACFFVVIGAFISRERTTRNKQKTKHLKQLFNNT